MLQLCPVLSTTMDGRAAKCPVCYSPWRVKGSHRSRTEPGLGLLLLAMGAGFPGRLLPSWQRLCRQGERCRSAVLARQHTSLQRCHRHPSWPCPGDSGASGLRRDALPVGWEHSEGHRPCRICREYIGVHRLSSGIDPGLSYLNELWPRASARKTFHLTSAIKAVTMAGKELRSGD